MLVRVHAISINPTDWKHIDLWHKDFGREAGVSNGCDFSGVIVAQGSDAEAKGLWEVGDAVAGFICAAYGQADNGAFQGARLSIVLVFILSFPDGFVL